MQFNHNRLRTIHCCQWKHKVKYTVNVHKQHLASGRLTFRRWKRDFAFCQHDCCSIVRHTCPMRIISCSIWLKLPKCNSAPLARPSLWGSASAPASITANMKTVAAYECWTKDLWHKLRTWKKRVQDRMFSVCTTNLSLSYAPTCPTSHSAKAYACGDASYGTLWFAQSSEICGDTASMPNLGRSKLRLRISPLIIRLFAPNIELHAFPKAHLSFQLSSLLPHSIPSKLSLETTDQCPVDPVELFHVWLRLVSNFLNTNRTCTTARL